ncbi:TetR/AcrR family transcriptional regulator [Gemmatirosa kalamazoonensis]|uniref:TetR/AcrR family transcriptional regulator n=1 Tax=Gemmatirosa kalamazoonensis TaxID=861299 RepID=UPI00046C8C01|nr:TetR/AcrR family transcriptional regulator [Gemmatirosa kalamazoonensis]
MYPSSVALSSRPAADKADKADKRSAILAAALRLIARSGLHNTPMAAIAREAGVAAGTLYLYFPSKEAMVNALYLDLIQDRDRAYLAELDAIDDPTAGPAESTWRIWHALARWHLDRPDASNLIHQCRASGILTDETRAAEARDQAARLPLFRDAIAHGQLRELSQQVFWALFAGPILALVQMRDAGEIDVDDDVLRATFDGVCRSVLP